MAGARLAFVSHWKMGGTLTYTSDFRSGSSQRKRKALNLQQLFSYIDTVVEIVYEEPAAVRTRNFICCHILDSAAQINTDNRDYEFMNHFNSFTVLNHHHEPVLFLTRKG